MNFDLSEEIKGIRETVRRFAQEEIVSRAWEEGFDRDPVGPASSIYRRDFL